MMAHIALGEAGGWGEINPTALACIAFGEAGGTGIWGDQDATEAAWRLVMQVARNRAISPDFPIAHGDVAFGFFNVSQDAPERVIEIAREVLEAPLDSECGAFLYFIISEQDRKLLDFPDGDVVLRGVGNFALHAYKEWPRVFNRNSNKPWRTDVI